MVNLMTLNKHLKKFKVIITALCTTSLCLSSHVECSYHHLPMYKIDGAN